MKMLGCRLPESALGPAGNRYHGSAEVLSIAGGFDGTPNLTRVGNRQNQGTGRQRIYLVAREIERLYGLGRHPAVALKRPTCRHAGKEGVATTGQDHAGNDG